MTSLRIWLDETERWDIKSAQAAVFRREHPSFVPFGSFVEEATQRVDAASEPDKEWPVYGVSNSEGVFLSHTQQGQNFRTAYKKIERDWFFHNPTRANVGSMGRVKEVLPDAITSPEYQVWRIKDTSWSADFVEVLLRMPFFNHLVHIHRVGAVKERLYVENLLEMPVPARDSAFQKAIVDEWNATLALVQKEERAIEDEECKLVEGVMASVGIQIDTSVPRGRSFVMHLDEVPRWSVEFNRHRWTLESLITSTRWPCARIVKLARVNPPRTRLVGVDDLISFVPMEAVSSVSGAIDGAEERPFAEVASGYTPFEEGDVIWAKITPCMQNGKCALAKGLKNGVGFGSTEFHVIRSLDPEAVLAEYLWVILRLLKVRVAATRYFTGSAGQQRVPSDFLERLWVPVPDPQTQHSVYEAVMASRQVIGTKRELVMRHRRDLIERAERQIIRGVLEPPTSPHS
jgi:type I restriction enzyme S subunit